MALATLADAPPPSLTKPGLAARMSSLSGALGAVVADLDPGLLLGSDAASLYGDFCRLERLVTAGKTLLAPRIAESGHWETEGHRSPAGLLATLEGGTSGQAKRTLDNGKRLVDLPGTEEALRQGSLSGSKLSEVTLAGSLDPDSESSLLAGIDSEPLQVIRERCQRIRATSTRNDPVAALSRIHASRSFASWTTAEGAFCFEGRDTPERGAALLARLVPVANRLRSDRRAAATEAARNLPKGSPDPTPESEKSLLADALFLLVTRTRSAPPGPATPSEGPRPSKGSQGSKGSHGSTNGSTGSTKPSDGPVSTVPVDPADPPSLTDQAHSTDLVDLTNSPSLTDLAHSTDLADLTNSPSLTDLAHATDLADPVDLGSAEDLITAAPPATIIVRVDLEALRRGRALPGELCELDGQGPVPAKVAQSLLDDAFVALVFTESGDIRSVVHRGRTINAHLRTALVLRDRNCVVPGCGVAYGLEIDHVKPLEFGGDTRLDNLALLCRHHHRLKTYEGWTLERTGPTDEDPRWCFTPLPPFGEEPDLGLDRPPEPVPRK